MKSLHILYTVLWVIFASAMGFSDRDAVGSVMHNQCANISVLGAGGGSHVVCEPENSRGELMLYFCGSGGQPQGALDGFIPAALQLGYAVIGIRYLDSPSIAEACAKNPSIDCSKKTRLARLYGGQRIVTRDGAIPRLKALLTKLAAQNSARWSPFVAEGGRVEWSRVATAGHSQGAGMAIMVAQEHAVARVVQLAGVDDVESVNQAQPAPWVKEASATPRERFFGLGNVHGEAQPLDRSIEEADLVCLTDPAPFFPFPS